MTSSRGMTVASIVTVMLAAEPLSATPPAIPARLLATMNQPPRGSDDVLQWLKAHGDEVSRGLVELGNYDAHRQPLWAYAKVKRRSWRTGEKSSLGSRRDLWPTSLSSSPGSTGRHRGAEWLWDIDDA